LSELRLGTSRIIVPRRKSSRGESNTAKIGGKKKHHDVPPCQILDFKQKEGEHREKIREKISSKEIPVRKTAHVWQSRALSKGREVRKGGERERSDALGGRETVERR